MADTPERFRILARIDAAIGYAEAFVLGAAMIVMAVNTIANVLGRFVFSQSLYFSEELNEILMVLVTFVGLGYVTRRGRHIRMSAIYDQLPDRGRKIAMLVIAGTTGAAMLVLAWFAWEYVLRVAARGQVTPALQLPLWTVYVWVIVGFVITAIQYFLTALRNLNLSEPSVYISASEIDTYEDPELAEMMSIHARDQDAAAEDRR